MSFIDFARQCFTTESSERRLPRLVILLVGCIAIYTAGRKAQPVRPNFRTNGPAIRAHHARPEPRQRHIIRPRKGAGNLLKPKRLIRLPGRPTRSPVTPMPQRRALAESRVLSVAFPL
jgi:hypothetical protein